MLKAMMKKRNAGFTLVELMIVVAIIGVLAALAIYGVSRYLKHAKTAEATRSLAAIETGSKNKYNKESDLAGDGTGPFVHKFCDNAPKTPATTPKAEKKLVPASDWANASWVCLNFTINEPQFYSYTYVTNAATGTAAEYTATANGDLDGNGTESTFSLIGNVNANGEAARRALNVINEDE